MSRPGANRACDAAGSTPTFGLVQRFDGKVAVITGATAGIGAEAARRLAREGACLVLVGRRPAARAAILQELDAARTLYISRDITEAAAAPAIIDAAITRFERVDVLVNNAGRDHTGDLLSVRDEDVRATFETNFFAAFRLLQAAGLVMREAGGGSIVNVTSRLAVIGFPAMSVYGASKGALLTLTRGAAVELAPAGIRVTPSRQG